MKFFLLLDPVDYVQLSTVLVALCDSYETAFYKIGDASYPYDEYRIGERTVVLFIRSRREDYTDLYQELYGSDWIEIHLGGHNAHQ